MVRAITFDFWDTLVKDDSDEPKRAALGLPTKPQARLQLLVDEIADHHPAISLAQVAEALKAANQHYNHQWKNHYVTPSVADRLQFVYDALKIGRTPGFDAVVRRIEEMEVMIRPDFAPGVDAALAELARRFALGIISDTIHTPGRGIRRMLADEGLLPHFRHCIFSDEAGASKPSPAVFEQAAAGLGVPLAEIVHVGDRESNDVTGPMAVGMKAVLYTGWVDRDSANTRATAVCKDFASLPKIILSLD